MCRVWGRQCHGGAQRVQMDRNGRRTSTHNDARDSRQSNTINDETVNIVRTLLDEDQHYMLNDLHHKIATQYKYVSCSQMSIHTILINHVEI